MCGLFGINRIENSAASTDSYLALLFALGVRSEERGRHSAGLAVFPESDSSHCRVVKDTVPFRRLDVSKSGIAFDTAKTVLGHTRFATQGSATDIKNASPISLDTLTGTHNGDIVKSSIPNHKEHQKKAKSSTDTEILYRELQKFTPGSSEFLKALEVAVGRIALAFVSTLIPNALVLVRGALSPLAYAYTADGTLVYGSNPNWFRQIEQESKGNIKFTGISLIPEGTVLIFNRSTNTLMSTSTFIPTCRESDLHLVNSSVFKNFTMSDKQAFKSLAYHKLLADKLPERPAIKVVPGYQEVAPARLSFEDGVLFDDLFLAGKSTEPFTPEKFDERVSLEDVEALCNLGKDFDEESYLYLLEALDEEELEFRYSEVFIEMFRAGLLNDDIVKKLELPLPLDAVLTTSV